jgi:type VI secretion system VasD/TssJ family lipoprotein
MDCKRRSDRRFTGRLHAGCLHTVRLHAGRRGAVVLLSGLAMTAAGCGIFGGGKSADGGGGGGREITLVLSAGAKLNTCGDGPANALGVRVYQLGGDRGISGAPQAALWENDQKELGPELLDKQELFLDPGSKQPMTLHLKPQARAVAVVGNFCQSQGTCWKWVQPVEGMRSEIVLRFGETCVEAAR